MTGSLSHGLWIYKNSIPQTRTETGDSIMNGASVAATMWLNVGDYVYLLSQGQSLMVDGNSVFTGIKIN